MKDVNVAAVSGRLGRDPELRKANQQSVCNFSVATNESYKDSDGKWQERASWFDIVVWGVQGENCAKYLSKGSQVFVQGRLKQNSWETQEGDKRSKVQIVADVVIFPPASSGGARPSGGEKKSVMDGLNFDDIEADDIPF